MPRKLTLEERIERIRERKTKFLERMKKEADAIYDSKIEVLKKFGPKELGVGLVRESIDRMFEYRKLFYEKKGVKNAAEKAVMDIHEWREGIRNMGLPDIKRQARERLMELIDKHTPRLGKIARGK